MYNTMEDVHNRRKWGGEEGIHRSSLYFLLDFSVNLKVLFKKNLLHLAGVAQWIECRSSSQRVAGSIPSQSTCLGYRPGPQ